MLPLKPKPLDQKSDQELEKDLLKVTNRDSWLYRNSKHVNHGIAVGLFAGGYYTAKYLCGIGMATGNPFILMAGVVSAPAIWAVGAVGCAIGWANIGNRLSSCFRKQAGAIQKEQQDRAFKKTPAYKEILRHAAEEAVRIKDSIKKAFNDAVDKAFHSGTENKVAVRKPLQLKKPGETPKKKSFFGL